MAIDLQALSITKTIDAIISFFRSQENNSAWKDLTNNAEGLFLIRLLANVMTNISYRLVSARRENYLSTANLLSSNIGIAVNLGYSAYRGRNQHRRITVTPTVTQTIPNLSIIGTYNDEYSIIAVSPSPEQDITFVYDETAGKGVPQEIDVVIGTVKTLTINPDTQAITVFQQFVQNISEDYMLTKYKEGDAEPTVVPTTTTIKDMIYDKYLVRTNPYNSVDIMYLNNKQDAKYSYDDETELTLTYVELADVPTIPFTSDMFTYCTIDNTIALYKYIPFATVDEIKIKAPIEHEVQNLIRSKVDYSKRLKEDVPNVKETSYFPITPTYTLLTYLKDDYSFLTEGDGSEKNLFMKTLDDENYFGTPLPDITYPRRLTTQLNITLKVTNKYMSVNDIRTDIDNILLTNYDVLLEQTFNVYQLERLLENTLSYVVYARVSINTEERQGNNLYELGTVVEENEVNYIADKVLGISGSTEPNLNISLNMLSKYPTQIDISSVLEQQGKNAEIIDGGLIWRIYKKLPYIENITLWQPSTKYKLGDYVSLSTYSGLMLKCVNMIKQSGTVEPSTEGIEEGDFINDGELVWVCVPYIDYSVLSDAEITDDNPASYSNDQGHQWVAESQYKLGAKININGLSFNCISFNGQTESTNVTFETEKYQIIEIGEQLVEDTLGNISTKYSFILGNDLSQYYKEGDEIQVELENGNLMNYTIDSISVGRANISWNGITYGTDKFVTVGSNGSTTYSIDGVKWNEITQNGLVTWNNITYGNNIYMAVGSFGYIMTSNDGITWNEPKQVGSTTWKCTTYGSTFVIGGLNGYTIYSNDGEIWSAPTQVGTNDWNCTLFANNKYVMAGAEGYIINSDDGQTWSTPTQNGAYNWVNLVYENNKFILTSSDGYSCESTDGVTWTEPVLTGVLPYNSKTFGDNKYVWVNAQGYSSYSTDNSTWSTPTLISQGNTNFENITTIIPTVDLILTNDYTYILSPNRGTQDGSILWKIVEDIEEVTYDWNVYNTFSYNLTVK